MPDADLAIFVAEQILAFRKRVLEVDPHFFDAPENQAVYQTFVSSLPHVWVAQRMGQIYAAVPAKVLQ